LEWRREMLKACKSERRKLLFWSHDIRIANVVGKWQILIGKWHLFYLDWTGLCWSHFFIWWKFIWCELLHTHTYWQYQWAADVVSLVRCIQHVFISVIFLVFRMRENINTNIWANLKLDKNYKNKPSPYKLG
jgi:hypothetical protein